MRACGGSTSARPCACMRVCEHVRAIQCVHALARARSACVLCAREAPAVGSAAAVTQCAQRLRASRTATAHEATLQRQSARASRRTAAAPLQHGATWRNVAQHVATRHNLAQHVATLRLNAPPVLFPLSSRGRITLCYLSPSPCQGSNVGSHPALPTPTTARLSAYHPGLHALSPCPTSPNVGFSTGRAATCCCRCGSM